MDLLSLLVGVAGTLLAAWAAVSGRQLVRPKLLVRPSLYELPSNAPFSFRVWRRNEPPEIIAIGVSALEAEHVVLAVPIRVENRGSVPVNDVEVVIEIASNAAVKGMGLIGPVGDTMGALETTPADGRTVSEFKGMVQSRIPVGLVRPGQTTIVGDYIQLRTSYFGIPVGSGDDSAAELIKRRNAGLLQLRSAAEVRISVWSGTLKPVSFSVVVMWLAVQDVSELTQAIGRMAAMAAEGRIKPGIYFQPWFWKRLHRDALVELAMVHATSVKDLAHALSIDGTIDRTEGAVVLRVPPWGLWGESFNVAKLGATLIRRA